MKPQTLYSKLIAAREEEEKAHQKALKIEEELFQYLKPQLTKSEGQETIEELGYSIVVNQPTTWKLDEAKYRALAEKLPDNLQFHRTKLELDKVRYKIILETHEAGELEKEMQDCVTVKPGKVSVKVEKIEVK
jgi:ABC-type thiamine transport system ATPase subunit